MTPKGLDIERAIEPDDEVLPQTVEDVARGIEPESADVEFLLKNLELYALPFHAERAELHTLMLMFEHLHNRTLTPVGWYVAAGGVLAYFLALGHNESPSMLFGIPVHYVAGDHLPEGKLLLVGSKSHYTVDATHGVIAEMG